MSNDQSSRPILAAAIVFTVMLWAVVGCIVVGKLLNPAAGPNRPGCDCRRPGATGQLGVTRSEL